MLKKENRLRSKKEFEAVKAGGCMHQTKYFGWLELRVGEGGKQFGMIISKKISKRAVDRNRIRRRLAESIKNNLERVEEGVRVLVLGKKEILNVGEKQIEEELQLLLGHDKENCSKDAGSL